MGVEQALTMSMVMQSGASIYQGIEAKKTGDSLAKEYEKRSELAIKESKDEARRQMRINQVNNARMKLNFLKLGVGMSGSVLNVLATNKNLQNEEINAVLTSGYAMSDYFRLQGSNAKSTGRAKLTGSLVSGASNVLDTYAKGRMTGYFSGNKKSKMTSEGKATLLKY